MSDISTIPHEAPVSAVNDRATTNPLSKFIAPIIGLAFFLVQIPFARFAFDSHHDGYMLAAAIGVRDGGVIHRDVFTLYGPVTPLVQATWLLLPMDPHLRSEL